MIMVRWESEIIYKTFFLLDNVPADLPGNKIQNDKKKIIVICKYTSRAFIGHDGYRTRSETYF